MSRHNPIPPRHSVAEAGHLHNESLVWDTSGGDASERIKKLLDSWKMNSTTTTSSQEETEALLGEFAILLLAEVQSLKMLICLQPIWRGDFSP